MTARRAHIAVIGGGIAGLTAAFRLRQALGESCAITIFESSYALGGKLRSVPFGESFIDVGAEAFLVRRPEVLDLVADLGLTDHLAHPSGRRPLLWVDDAAHPLPERTMLGIPTQPGQLDDIVDAVTRERIAGEPSRPLEWVAGSDVSLGELVEQRFGEQVVQRSVDPLIGGVYSGSAYSTGVRAALPTLAAALDRGAPSLTDAARQATANPAPGPVFGALAGGYAMLVDALLAQSAAAVRTGAIVQSLELQGGGVLVDGQRFDAAVLATPAPVAARLLDSIAPQSSSNLASFESASSAVVVLRLARDIALPDNSGVLVATGETLHSKAFTFASQKWPHLNTAFGPVVRCSLGRFSEQLPADDRVLADCAVADLSHVLGFAVAPVEIVVQRWPEGLPQYTPGHIARVADIRRGLAAIGSIALAGNYLDGVGVAATVASGNRAAVRIAESLTA